MNTETPHIPKLLEDSIPLVSFSDFIRAVPERWRSAPLYLGVYSSNHKAVTVRLSRDDNGKRVIILKAEYEDLKK